MLRIPTLITTMLYYNLLCEQRSHSIYQERVRQLRPCTMQTHKEVNLWSGITKPLAVNVRAI